MSEVSLSIVIPSCGRPTLIRAMESCSSQMNDCDEMFVRLNQSDPWGHATRNRLMSACTGTHLCWTDDDDEILPGAFDAIRSTVSLNPDRLHIFRMLYRGGVIWREPTVVCGNFSTQQIVCPNIPGKLGQWADVYEGDFWFVASTLKLLGTEPVFATPIIARYGN